MSSRRLTAFAATITLILVSLWLVVMIIDAASAGPLKTFEQTLSYAERQTPLFYLNYWNAGLFTVAVVLLFVGLHDLLRNQQPLLSRWALIFVPMYGLLNLITYWSQVTVVPYLLLLRSDPQQAEVATMLLRLFIHIAPNSLIGFINALAYLLLGIPSVVFGVAMLNHAGAWRIAGLLFILSAVADVFGFIGLAAHVDIFAPGLLAGGALFLLALFPLTWVLWQKNEALS